MRKIFKRYTEVILLILPLFLMPLVIDSLGFGKNFLLVVSGIVGLVLWLMTMALEKKWVVKVNKMWWIMVAALIWSWAGWLILKIQMGVRMASLMTPMGMGTLLGIVVWMFLWIQASNKEDETRQVNLLTISGGMVAVVSLIVFLLPANKLPWIWPSNNPILSIDGSWSLTGSMWGEAVLLMWLIFEWMKRLMVKLKENEKDINGYVVEAGAVVFLALIFVLDIFRLSKMMASTLDLNSSWVIATEALKRSPWFGAGLGNYTTAFNLLRPASFNLGSNWTAIFGTATMGWLQWWTELGIGGLVLIGAMVWAWLGMRKSETSFWEVGLFLLIIGLTPFSLIGVVILVWLLATKFESREIKLRLGLGDNEFNVMPAIVGVVTVASCGFAGYWAVRIMLGELYMRQALLAASRNEANSTYNLQIKAIGQNPYVGGYRRIASQTHLVLAQAYLMVKNPTDDDKQKASILIQQSVGEAKAAIALDGTNYQYWANLAAIYKSIIGLVDGAADWSYQAYVQATALDPVNPLLKLDLGGLLYAANRFDEADRVFEQLVRDKQNFANGWYNWAYTAKRRNRPDLAVQRMSQAVALVPVDSGDYDKASKELDAWKKELDELVKKQQELISQQQKQAETLKTPEPLPTVGPGEKVNVPINELEPPKAVVTVTPEPTKEATASPTPTIKQ